METNQEEFNIIRIEAFNNIKINQANYPITNHVFKIEDLMIVASELFLEIIADHDYKEEFGL
jgi:hypothetical protein